MSGILKAISPLFHLVGLAWLGLLLTALICLRRRRWLGSFASLGVAAVMWVVAQPPIVLPLLAELERPWLKFTVGDAPKADAVVVLGGGWRESTQEFSGLDLTPAADRLMTGIELCRLGRGAELVLGGDPAIPTGESGPDSGRVRHWIEHWGLSGVPMHTLGPVLNTYDEAKGAKELVERKGWKQVLLVTSAFHMRRALAVFAKAGVPVHPVACDFQAERLPSTRLEWRLFPEEESFVTLGLWWHEQLGWLMYRATDKL